MYYIFHNNLIFWHIITLLLHIVVREDFVGKLVESLFEPAGAFFLFLLLFFLFAQLPFFALTLLAFFLFLLALCLGGACGGFLLFQRFVVNEYVDRFGRNIGGRLLPRGFSSSDISSNNYLAGSVDYQFPLCYPEGGISGVIYFKRIRLNVGADYARFQEFGSRGKTWRDIYSYGGDLLLDLNILRMSAAATATVKLSLYKPSEGSCWFGFGLELPF